MSPITRCHARPAPHRRRLLAGVLAAGAWLVSACGGDSPTDTTQPVQPVAELGQPFDAVGSSARSVSLAWTPPPEAARYAIERRVGASGAFTRVATVDAKSGLFLDSGLDAGTTYGYRLAAAEGTRRETPARSATTTLEQPVTTPPGTPLGEFTGRTVGAAGGTLKAGNESIVVEVPAGAFAADTATEATPVSNTAPDGQGQGLKLRLAAAPRLPLTLTLRYESTLDDQADALAVAVQRAGGDWTSLPLRSIDKAARTLQAQLPPEFVAGSTVPGSAAVGIEFHVVKYLAFQLKPKLALVKVGTTLELVPYARVRGYEHEIGTCEPMPDGTRACILQPMLETRELPFANEKAGFSRDWSVSGIRGGNSAIGTVTPRAGGAGAVYKAPARVPQPSQLRVLFRSVNTTTQRTVDMAALVEVWDDHWSGTMKAIDGPSSTNTTYLNTATVYWHADPAASTPTVKAYRGEGTILAAVTDDDCTVTLAPDSAPIDADVRLVFLKVDESTAPMTYHARLITFFGSQVTAVCPRAADSRYARTAGWGWDVSGQVSADGRTIEGETVTEDGYRLSWKFTR